jgi:hypothetical protein
LPLLLTARLLDASDQPVDIAAAAQRITDNYATKPLGEYLTKLLGISEERSTFRNSRGESKKRSKTLEEGYKLKLAKLVAEPGVATWENIGPRAQKLAEDVYAFIEHSNRSS